MLHCLLYIFSANFSRDRPTRNSVGHYKYYTYLNYTHFERIEHVFSLNFEQFVRKYLFIRIHENCMKIVRKHVKNLQEICFIVTW